MSTTVMWLALLPAAAILLSAIERRRFWHHPHYDLINRSLACLGVGTVLMSPLADPIGYPIERLTGLTHSEDVLAHTLIVVGIICVTSHALRIASCLTPRVVGGMQHGTTIFVVALWITWANSDMSVDTDITVKTIGGVVYWWIFAGGLAVLGAIAVGVFSYVARNSIRTINRRVARLYVIAGTFLVGAAICRMWELYSASFTPGDLVLDYSLRTVAVIALVAAAHQTFSHLKRPVTIPATVPRIDA